MHVFTYGSLMFPEVWQRVTGLTGASEPALLPGHARYAVSGASYPGMLACPGQHVAGVLYRDVDAAAIAALDAFEGPEYRRTEVRITGTDGLPLTAAAYLYLLPQKLSASPWRPEAFDVAGFIAAHCRRSRSAGGEPV